MVGALLVVAAGYGVYSLMRSKAAALPFQNFTITKVTDNGKSIEAAISADGKYVLSVVADTGKQSLWLRHVETNSDTPVSYTHLDVYKRQNIDCPYRCSPASAYNYGAGTEYSGGT